MYNVVYDLPDGTPRTYLREPTSFAIAQMHCARFNRKYVGQLYPNGRGAYSFTNPRVVEVK